MTTYHLEFGKVGDGYPVPPTTVTAGDETTFVHAVAQYAIPYLRPALETEGRPELADCFFRANEDCTAGEFMWVDLPTGQGARFCGARIFITT